MSRIKYEKAQRALDIYSAVSINAKVTDLWMSARSLKSNIDDVCKTLDIDPNGKDAHNLLLYILEGVYTGKMTF